jgi:hypothetical protein
MLRGRVWEGVWEAIELLPFSGYSFSVKRCSKAIILCLLLVTWTAIADARDLRVRKKIEGYIIDATLTRNPPILGNNPIVIQMRDSADKPVVLPTVLVNYYMPPMPGMPPMNYTVKARQNGESCQAVMNFIMSGPWIIIIKATTPGKTLRMDIPIDVR